MNLVICLLVARGYVPKSRIRQVVAGYGDQSPEAFERMFERDKDDLREIGIPIETGSLDPFEDEPGYRIQRQEFELPEVHLEPDEAAVIGMAARVWQHNNVADAATAAVAKLQAAGVAADTDSLSAVEPRVGGEEPGFWPLWQAVRDRRPVRFDYRKNPDKDPMTRHLQPWSVLSWHGRWYVVGRDTDREAARLFRLSRIVGDVHVDGEEASYDVPVSDEVKEAASSLMPSPTETRATATLHVRQGAGHVLRRRAEHLEPLPEPGWDEVRLPYSSTSRLVQELVTYGPDVVVVQPQELRDAVITWLDDIAGAAA
jgi:predicted DNA-binding transcriptional regulator YafY